MTAQEAIEMMQGYQATDAVDRAEWDAFQMAIEALEKQIPKNVIFEDDGEELLCPRCGFDLMGSITDPDHDPYYCFECGQALKWGEEHGNCDQ